MSSRFSVGGPGTVPSVGSVPTDGSPIPGPGGPWNRGFGAALGSEHVELADGDVQLLARLGDPVAEPLVLGLELAGVHAEDLAEEGDVAGVGLAAELAEGLLDLVGEVEEELGLPLDLGQGA